METIQEFTQNLPQKDQFINLVQELKKLQEKDRDRIIFNLLVINEALILQQYYPELEKVDQLTQVDHIPLHVKCIEQASLKFSEQENNKQRTFTFGLQKDYNYSVIINFLTGSIKYSSNNETMENQLFKNFQWENIRKYDVEQGRDFTNPIYVNMIHYFDFSFSGQKHLKLYYYNLNEIYAESKKNPNTENMQGCKTIIFVLKGFFELKFEYYLKNNIQYIFNVNTGEEIDSNVSY